MKKISNFLIIILCGVTLIFSYTSWKEKISSAGKPVDQKVITAPAEETKKETAGVSGKTTDIHLEKLTAKMDTQVQDLFFSINDKDEAVQLLILGSNVMNSGEPGYAELLKQALDTSYGGFIETEILSFDGTSEEFMLTDPQFSASYDVVLMEPFTLMNNGIVQIETEHSHIEQIFDKIQNINDEAVLILHPPQPIYGARFYLTQVDALKNFADSKGYAYINHWNLWPSTDEATLKDYLTEESIPNKTGAETWANALIAYFTGS